MSIFSKADRHLPLLTQVYQLNALNRDELAEFAVLQFPQMWLLLKQKENNPEGYRIETDNIREAVLLTQSVMRSLYLKKGIDVTDASKLNAFLQEHRFMRAIHFSGRSIAHLLPSPLRSENSSGVTQGWVTKEEGANLNILVSSIIPINELIPQEDGDAATTIAAGLWELVTGMVAGKKVLQKCDICDSIYLQDRRGQSYCSRRCADTAGSRRRRKEKKSDFVAV